MDGILFTVFWNIFIVEIKEKTKSVNNIKDAQIMRFSTVSTLLFLKAVGETKM